MDNSIQRESERGREIGMTGEPTNKKDSGGDREGGSLQSWGDEMNTFFWGAWASGALLEVRGADLAEEGGEFRGSERDFGGCRWGY